MPSISRPKSSMAWKHWYTIIGTAVPSLKYKSSKETPKTGFNGGRCCWKLPPVPPAGGNGVGAAARDGGFKGCFSGTAGPSLTG